MHKPVKQDDLQQQTANNEQMELPPGANKGWQIRIRLVHNEMVVGADVVLRQRK